MDRAFDSLGQTAKLAFYLMLKRDFGISKEAIASDPRKLLEAIEKILGTSGKDFMQHLITNEINREFGLSESPREKSLVSLFERARTKFTQDSDIALERESSRRRKSL